MSGHVIKRFYERVLGFSWKPRRGRELSSEISGFIKDLMSKSYPYAKAQHNVLIYRSEWCCKDGKKIDVFILVDYTVGGMKIRTIMTWEEHAKKYFKAGTWEKIWRKNKVEEKKRKKCGG